MPKLSQQNLLSCFENISVTHRKAPTDPLPQWRIFKTHQKIYPKIQFHALPTAVPDTACSTGSSVKRCAVCVAKDCTATSKGDAGGKEITLEPSEGLDGHGFTVGNGNVDLW